ncbi:MAG: MarR family transcriptional regulator [Pseudomonadota bacterium]
MSDLSDLEPLLPEDAFEANLNFRLLRLASLLSTHFQRTTLRKKNVSVQEYRLMVSIARHGAGHLRDLARKAAIDPAHASRAMKAMLEKGWVRRRPHPSDKRRAIYSITPAGKDVFFSIYPAADEFARQMAAPFTPEQVEQFRDMIDLARVQAARLLEAETLKD